MAEDQNQLDYSPQVQPAPTRTRLAYLSLAMGMLSVLTFIVMLFPSRLQSFLDQLQPAGPLYSAVGIALAIPAVLDERSRPSGIAACVWHLLYLLFLRMIVHV